jgi:hypothetical protein
MKVGDVIESSIWITGDENPEMRKQYEIDVRQAIADLCASEHVSHGPITFHELHPDNERTPQVPDHVQGSRVRLLVGEATVDHPVPVSSQGSFVANLDKKDLLRLRLITRKAWAKQNPKDVLTDQQCDEYIEQFGPEAAVETLRSKYHTLQ